MSVAAVRRQQPLAATQDGSLCWRDGSPADLNMVSTLRRAQRRQSGSLTPIVRGLLGIVGGQERQSCGQQVVAVAATAVGSQLMQMHLQPVYLPVCFTQAGGGNHQRPVSRTQKVAAAS